VGWVRKRSWRSRPLLIGILAGMVLAIVFAVIALTPEKELPVYADLVDEENFDDASFEKSGAWYGLCQRNSIRSIEDFRKAVFTDETLKVHFADFKWENAVVKRLERPTPAYVYYRKGDVIFQKAKAIELPAGDEYITDGKTRVRTHCCNDYTEAPPLIASYEAEPPPEEPLLEGAPLLPVLPGTSAPVPVAHSSSQGTPYWLWPVFSGGSGSPHGHDRHRPPGDIEPFYYPPLQVLMPPGDIEPFYYPPPPSRVPEPNGTLLLGFGLAVIGLISAGCYRGVRRTQA
jgi:hypothetical protein